MDNILAKEIWDKFAQEDIIDDRLDPIISKSWKKCRDNGLLPNSEWKDLNKSTPNAFKSILFANSQLLDVSIPIMENVKKIITNTESVIVLTDSLGYVLKIMGDLDGKSRPTKGRIEEGDLWNDSVVGTNSVSLVLDNDIPIQLTGAEHFKDVYHGRCCCSAPIHDRNNELIGTINISGPKEVKHLHSLALVTSMAFSIESMLARGNDAHLMHVSMEGINENIILLDYKFISLYINKNARETLGIESENGLDFTKIIPNIEWDRVRRSTIGEDIYFDQIDINISNTQYKGDIRITSSINKDVKAYTINLKMNDKLIQSANNVLGNKARYSFDDMFANNENMKKVITLAKKFAHYDSSIVIEGEVGTELDVLAQSIHNESMRSEESFVSIDCASISRRQIKRELFGDKDENYSITKFIIADKGTLFINSIDKLTIDLQIKLLEVINHLENNDDINLGNPRLILGTNEDLVQMCNEGLFNKQLYDKISAINIKIPPVRERQEDIESLVKAIINRLNKEHSTVGKSYTKNYMDVLKNYSWPGNLKELEVTVEQSFFRNKSIMLETKDIVFGNDSEKEKNKFEIENNEKNNILNALESTNHSVDESANMIGVSRATFYRLCLKYGIEPKKLKRNAKK